MKRFIILFLIIFFCIGTYAEMTEVERKFHEEYGIVDMTPCESEIGSLYTRSGFNCSYVSSRGKSYAPLFIPNEDDPIMNVRINLIFIQKDDGTGNFQKNDIEHQTLFDDIITQLNQTFSTLVMPGTDCFNGTDDELVHDTRIRFVDHRYYIKDSRVWNNNLYNSGYNLCPAPWYLDSFNDSLTNATPDISKAINVYFTEDSTVYHHFWEVQDLNDTSDVWIGNTTGACSQFPSYSNLQQSSCVHIPCQYSKFWWMKHIVPQMWKFHYPSWEYQVRYWLVDGLARSLAHELGHSFNLLHPHNEPVSETFYPFSSCGSSIMTQSGSSPRNFLPPEEIGRMYFHTMTTNLQQYIPSTTYLGAKTLNTTVSLPRMRMYYSLIIGPSGNVTIPCNITFSTQGSIIVENGGILSIDGANLYGTDSKWGGIEVQSGGSLILSDVNISNYNIVVKSGGSVVVRNNLTVVGDHYVKVEDGGYLCIDNNASIDLVDDLSYFILSPNVIFGCPSCSDDCLTSMSDVTYSGDGHIATYENTNFIQNTTISNDNVVYGSDVYAGYDVTTTIPFGNVVIMPGSSLRVFSNSTILTKDVEIKEGGALLINK